MDALDAVELDVARRARARDEGEGAARALQRAAKLGRGPLANAALRSWTRSRELPDVPKQTFRDWWRDERS